MTDAELLRFGEAAKFMYSADSIDKPLRTKFVIHFGSGREE
jgi:hypothetical protein